MIDLHAHTRASDGQYPAEELVLRAREAGLSVLGVTDHDTVAGLPAALEAGRRAGLRVVPGIELSSFVRGREAHILGHFIDPDDERLRGFSRLLRAQRERRMARMVEKLRALGVRATFEEVVAESSGKNLGRPHLARVLVKHGYVRDLKEAFERYLSAGKPAFVERYKLTSEEAIELVGRAGGCATLAHAFASRLSREEIVLLKEQGLAGLEVAHPDHSPGERAKAARLAVELDLVPTAGSDFHGELIMPERRLGMATMEERELERLEARATKGRMTMSGEVLAAKECVPCRGGIPPLAGKELDELAAQLPAWKVVDGHHLERAFKFKDFKEALEFTNRVGALAEGVGHHPNLLLSWGKVVVTLWTHKIDGLHESDFVLAAKIDRL